MVAVSRHHLTLALILILGFILRFLGVDFGLPHLYHADEPIIVNQAIGYGAGNWIPIHGFKIPQLVGYLVFFVYGIYFVALKLLGVISGAEEFGRMFVTDPSSFYLLARILFGVLLGTFQIYLLYQLVAKNFSKSLGLLTALFFALCFMHVRNSHYIYMDIPLLTAIIGSFFLTYRILEKPKRKDYILFGLLLGVAVALKYNGVFVVVPFVLAHLIAFKFDLKKLFDPNLFLAAFLSLASFLLCSPVAVLHPEMLFTGAGQIKEFESHLGWTHHYFYSLRNALGSPYLFCATLGLVWTCLRMDKKRAVFFCYVLFYYAILSTMSQEHDRYVLPILPFVAFFAADFIQRLQIKFHLNQVLTGLLVVVALSVSVFKIVKSDLLFLRDDERTVALHWLEENLEQGSRIALNVPFYNPRLKPTLEQLEEKREFVEGSAAKEKRLAWMIDEARQGDERRFNLYYLSEDLEGVFTFTRPRLPFDVSELKKNKIQYVLRAKTNKSDQREFFESLRREAELIKVFSPYPDPGIQWPLNSRYATGGVSLTSELLARKRHGSILELYRLN